MKEPENRRGFFLSRPGIGNRKLARDAKSGVSRSVDALQRIWYRAEFNQNFLAEKNQRAYIRKCRAFFFAELKLAPTRTA